MKRANIKTKSDHSIELLSRLLLTPRDSALGIAQLTTDVVNLTKNTFDCLVALAGANHVIIRAIGIFRDIAVRAGDAARTVWADEAIAVAQARIDNAIPFLDSIRREFANQRRPIAVIKSLDHWPDLGSDLDLYTDATPSEVMQLMKQAFDAKIAERSWGDRLAGKWNFVVPGLPELVEIHVGRLGQTGEQAAFSSGLIRRTREVEINDLTFPVPSISDRLVISVLQRMYRHFYFRLCDIVDSASLVEGGSIDYADLRAVATAAGIWNGVATYLVIVSDYVQRFRGIPLDLPEWVLIAARFDARDMYFARDFLRIPILPHSARLYGSQIVDTFCKRQINNGARLSLLPWLATAALVGQKMTGSDKGIW